jgi:hypothetical protein
MAHTPGPWTCERDPNREEFFISSASREGFVPIAAVEYGFSGSIEAEQQANAPLIATAPDLLAACKAARDYVEFYLARQRRYHPEFVASDPALAEAAHAKIIAEAEQHLALIDAAITKAEAVWMTTARELARARIARVEAALGDGREVCPRCHATLLNFADICTADLAERCPGFEAIENAGKAEPPS